jgi:hypothetical protein
MIVVHDYFYILSFIYLMNIFIFTVLFQFYKKKYIYL